MRRALRESVSVVPCCECGTPTEIDAGHVEAYLRHDVHVLCEVCHLLNPGREAV
jgi:hypothetical protein